MKKEITPKDSIRISVLMAIYNCASTLEEALDSLFAQTYQGFKVILCDDGSSDTTYEIAKKYKRKYPDKIVLLKNKTNIKLPATLNRCLEFADTEFVARMDGDDTCKPDRFEKEIEFLDSNQDFAFVSTPMEYFDENGVFMIGKSLPEPQKKDFIFGPPYCHAPVMIRTSAIKAVNGYTVVSWTQRGEDSYLWAKLHHAGYRGYNLPQPLYSMRDDKNAFKRRTLKQSFLNIRRAWEIYKLMGISKFYIVFGIKDILTGVSPKWIYDFFHKRKN